jgi:hypothetical protein
MGYLLGGLVGGATLALSGYATLGIVLAADLIVCAVLILRVTDPLAREVVDRATARAEENRP